MDILETISENEITIFVTELWRELRKNKTDLDCTISTGLTFSSLKCYQDLCPLAQVMVDDVGTPAEFVKIMRGFLNEFITENVSAYSKEDYELIGLPDLLDDYFKIKKKNKIADITESFTDEELDKFLEELGTISSATTYSHFSFFGGLSKMEQTFLVNCKPVERFVESMRRLFTRDTLKRVEHLTHEELDTLPMKELIEIVKKWLEIEELKEQINVIVAGQMEPIECDGTEEIIEEK